MVTARHIGIVAVSAEGASLCYRTICSEGSSLLGPHAHPEISMHTYPLSFYMTHIEAGRWDEVGRMLLSSAGKLAEVGAKILICPDNTVHQALDLVRRDSSLHWLHIAEEVAALAAQRKFTRVGVLGTRYLMEGPVYPTQLSAKSIESVVPEEEERQRINTIIFDELVYGRLEEKSRSFFQGVIDHLGRRGCAAVILGCTEIPLLINDSDSPLPTLDSTRILARAALREATRDPRD
jgi:aspartate racemase